MPTAAKMPGRSGFAAVPRNGPSGKVPVSSGVRSCRARGPLGTTPACRLGEIEAEQAMSIWLRTIWVGTVLVVPGGFLLLFAYLLARAVIRKWQVAAVQNPDQGVRVLQVLRQVQLQDLLREARTAL